MISRLEPTRKHRVPMQYALMTAITAPAQNKITATVNIAKSSKSFNELYAGKVSSAMN